jgi:hypothetical protein
VKRPKELINSMPLHDYSPALQGAVSWLGDRYLLAEPVRRRNEERKHHFHSHAHPGRGLAVHVTH